MSIVIGPAIHISGSGSSVSSGDIECFCCCLIHIAFCPLAAIYWGSRLIYENVQERKEKKNEKEKRAKEQAPKTEYMENYYEDKMCFEEKWWKIERQRKQDRIDSAYHALGNDIIHFIVIGSHNQKVVEALKNQPRSIQRIVFEDVCGDEQRERMRFLKERVGYVEEPQ